MEQPLSIRHQHHDATVTGQIKIYNICRLGNWWFGASYIQLLFMFTILPFCQKNRLDGRCRHYNLSGDFGGSNLNPLTYTMYTQFKNFRLPYFFYCSIPIRFNSTIFCGNDPLGEVIDNSEFWVKEQKNVLYWSAEKNDYEVWILWIESMFHVKHWGMRNRSINKKYHWEIESIIPSKKIA